MRAAGPRSTPSAALMAAAAGVFAAPREIVESICGAARERTYPRLAALVRAGDASSDTWLMVAGVARASLTTADGQVVELRRYAAGDMFGAFVDPTPREQLFDVVALEPTTAALFAALDLLALAERHACVGIAATRLLIAHQLELNAFLVARITLSAAGRVCAELLRLARLDPDGAIRPAPVLSALAARVATTRETASRTVSDLVRRGLVRRDGDALIVTAPRRLEDLLV